MKVEVLIAPEYSEPVAEIKTNQLTSTIEKAVVLLEQEDFGEKLSIYQGKEIILIEKSSIQLVRTEVGKVIVYDAEGKWYETKTTLVDFENLLGENFIRISKSTIVNLTAVQSVKASFSGTLDILLENGQEDVISRKYKADFKKKLGV
ncbi:LytTR family DNA-binding domain-containing protein [Solibacillus cecembensis]|uniref:LytTR family DNA-binding domain-containing protein n=1 Tax=Solibacillus cecembensis TaxID=459347 RepID=UPI003D04B397